MISKRMLHCPASLLACSIYAISFALPVITIPKWRIQLSGAEVVHSCLSDSMYWIFTWSALTPNLFLYLAIAGLIGENWLLAKVCGLLALFGGVVIPVMAGKEHEHIQLHSGYYAWIVAMLLVTIAAFFRQT